MPVKFFRGKEKAQRLIQSEPGYGEGVEEDDGGNERTGSHARALRVKSGLEYCPRRLDTRYGRIIHDPAPLGFLNRERMRRAFSRAFGQPPQAVRRNS